MSHVDVEIKIDLLWFSLVSRRSWTVEFEKHENSIRVDVWLFFVAVKVWLTFYQARAYTDSQEYNIP